MSAQLSVAVVCLTSHQAEAPSVSRYTRSMNSGSAPGTSAASGPSSSCASRFFSARIQAA